MHHAFVVARLLPRFPYWMTNHVSHWRLPAFDSKPFLALHLQIPLPNFVVGPRNPTLFVISKQRPTAPGSQYFVLNQPEAEAKAPTLTVVPPLPFKEPLYLRVIPHINAEFQDTAVYRELVKKEKYQLDRISLERLADALKGAGPSTSITRNTGGKEEAGPTWDTWSGDTTYESYEFLLYRRFVQFAFELVPFKQISTENLDLQIFDDLPLIRQLTLDYIWDGCQATVMYFKLIEKNRPSFLQTHRIFRYPTLPTKVPNPSVDALLACTPHLLAKTKSWESFLRTKEKEGVNAEADGCEDWEEDAMDLDAMTLAEAVYAVEMDDIKVLVLSPRVLIDRDGVLRDVLTCVFPPSEYHFNPRELVELYVEHEAEHVFTKDSPSVIATVQAVAQHLTILVDESKIREALDIYNTPRLHQETSSMVSSAIQQGYSVLALPTSSPTEMKLLSQIPGLQLIKESTSPSFDWESITSLYPSFQRNQMLVVTGDMYHTGERASMAGFPTALISRSEDHNCRVNIPTAPPTCRFTSLTELWDALNNKILPLLEPKYGPQKDDYLYPPIRLHDRYQVNEVLGCGTYATTYGALHVYTGTKVAVKFDLNPSTSSLPYEAAIYAQLKGVPGIPRIRWHGEEANGYFIIMDRLGPNLEQLMKYCRGRFSLKTVLMLGEQMLSIFEQIHGRGIIVRDIKPENFALGFVEEYRCLHVFDFGLSKLWLDPTTGEHIPFRNDVGDIGTLRYASANVHLGTEPSRRDDIESIGFLLLYLLHGRLPWSGIWAPDIQAKRRRMGEMKRGEALEELLAHPDTPEFFKEYFKHCTNLGFEDKPDYRMLRGLLKMEAERQGWSEYDWEYDWWTRNGEVGTLSLDEYRFDQQLVQPPKYEQRAL